MKFNKKITCAVFFLLGILLFASLVSAVYMRSVPQYTTPGFYTGISSEIIYNQEMCREAGQDFIVQVAPLGCKPAVVRSDLLEDQEVNVFCPLAATKINPLIDVEAIEQIYIQGPYPEGVAHIGYHPSRAALGIYGDLNSPVLNNIGYMVVTLRRERNESAMPDFIEGNMSVKLRYDIQNAFGIGRATYYLPDLNDPDWQNKYSQYGFWEGRGYLRAESIEEDAATISIYSDLSQKVSTGQRQQDFVKRKMTSVRLREGEESNKIYLPGLGFCLASLRVKLDSLEAPDTRVKLKINSDIIEVARGEDFLEGKCNIVNIDKQGLTQKVKISCREDQRSGAFELKISPRVKLKIGEQEPEDYEIGDVLYEMEGTDKSVFLAYVGERKKDGVKFIVPMVAPQHNKQDFLNSIDVKALQTYTEYIEDETQTGIGIVDLLLKVVEFQAATLGRVFNAVVRGSDYGEWIEMGQAKEVEFLSEKLSGPLLVAFKFITKQPTWKTPTSYTKTTVEFIGFAGPQDRWEIERIEAASKEEIKFKGNYSKAFEDYDVILDTFAVEKYEQSNDGEIVMGEEALAEKIKLAFDTEQFRTTVDLCEEFRQSYSESEENLVEYCDNSLKLSNSESARRDVVIQNRVKKISFEGIYEPSIDEYSVEIFVSGAAEEGYNGRRILQKNKPVYLSEDESIILKDLEANLAVFDVSTVKESITEALVYAKQSMPIEVGDYKVIGQEQYKIHVDKINLKKFAKVSVRADINYEEAEADLSFKIGIEKRGIKLAPEEIRSKIEMLDEQIEKWQQISDTLYTTIKIGKTACLTTGAALTAINLLKNAKGKGIARQSVMRGEEGWYQRCSDMVEAGTYVSQEQCLIKNAGPIEDEVNKLYDVMQGQNEDRREIEKDFTTKKFLADDVVNTSGVMGIYTGKVVELLDNSQILQALGVSADQFFNPDTGKDPISITEMKNLLSYTGWRKHYDISELREVELYLRVLQEHSDDPNMKNIAKKRLYSLFLDIKASSRNSFERDSIQEELNNANLNVRVHSYGKEGTIQGIYEGGTLSGDKFEGIWSGKATTSYPIEIFIYEGTQYIAILKSIDGLEYYAERIHKYNGISNGKLQLGEEMSSEDREVFSSFKKYDASSYKNRFRDPEVRYYEAGTYAGLPAIVPFDLDNGWYAATKSTLPFARNIRSFDDSGRVNSFYLCNVGRDGLEEFFSGIGDDTCEMINLGTGQPYNQFPMLDSSRASNLVAQAVGAIEEASRAHEKGVREVVIRGQTIDVGPPALDIPDIQCQDFMSAKECNLIFNLCDPFFCPSSRCDFGGEYPVKSVIQSGILGSTMLCLPNYREGIVVPVCLTGIKAGIDSLIQFEKTYKSCLENNLETGQMVGICDEIYSVYMCEMFWREGIPLAKILIPKVMGNLLGQNLRGGGEYLGVLDAWEKAQASINYFTQYYATESFKAFKVRSVEQAGTPLCRNFISATTPGGSNIIDALTEPDSPVQFHGWFDEIPLTTVTNPPISQYKVFYYIYAGADMGAYYRVYLQSGPGGSFYRDTEQIIIVNASYVPKGDSVAVTRDLTAPSGYKNLCINVNGQEECGFKQVSTAASVNYLEDKYKAAQSEQRDFTKTAECISGRASAYSLLSPNIQSKVEELIDPAIYNREIIRVCATDNPGRGSDVHADIEGSRWVDVGYCDDPKMRCWLDTESVKDTIKAISIEEQALDEISGDYMDILMDRDGYLKKDQFLEKVGQIEREENAYKRLNMTSKIFDIVFFNHQKAYVYFLRAEAYADIALELYRNLRDTQVDEETEEDAWRDDMEDQETPRVESRLNEIFMDQDLQERLKNYEDIISRASERYDVSEDLIKSIIIQESGAKPGETDEGITAGQISYGLMQVSEIAALDVKQQYNNQEHDVLYDAYMTDHFDIVPNVRLGVAYYARLRTRYSNAGNTGDDLIKMSLAAYNWGPTILGTVCEGDLWSNCENIPPDVLDHVDNIFAYQRLVVLETVPAVIKKPGKYIYYFEAENKRLLGFNVATFFWSDARNEILVNFTGLGDRNVPADELDKPFRLIGINEEIKQKARELVRLSIEERGPPEVMRVPPVRERYQQLEQTFETYAIEYFPLNWQPDDFKALLVAIAEKESKLGYFTEMAPAQTDWVMGYREGEEQFKGAENQIKFVAVVLKRAFNNRVGRESSFWICNQYDTHSDEKVRCILGVYYSRISLSEDKGYQGIKATYEVWKDDLYNINYVEETMEFLGDWKVYIKGGESLI